MEFINSLKQMYEGMDLGLKLLCASAVIAGCIIISLLLSKLIVFVLSVLYKKRAKYVRKFFKPVFLFNTSLLFMLLLYILDSDGFSKTLRHALLVLAIIAVSLIVIRVILTARKIFLERYDVNARDNLKARKIHTQFNIISRIAIAIIVIFATGIILLTFDEVRQIGISLFASAGIISLVIGLAAQKVIAAFLAGIQIALAQPIRLDDVVVVENEWGRVEEISLTYIVIRIWDKRRLVVPTTYFMDKPFQNWTRVSADLLGTVFLYTDYTANVDELRDALNHILQETSLWDGKVGIIQVTNASEKSMELRILVSSHDSPTGWDLRVYVREKLIDYMQKNMPAVLPRSRVVLDSDSVK